MTFNPYHKPSPLPLPEKTISERREVSRVRLFEGDELVFEPGKRYFFDISYDRDGETNYLVEFTEAVVENAAYDALLKEYRGRHEEILEWEVAFAAWQAQQEEDARAKRREVYERLRVEFEGR